MSSRSDIFAAIRAAQSDSAKPSLIAAQARACAEAMKATLPALPADDLVKLFEARAGAEKVGATLERAATLKDFPAAVARYIAANALPTRFSLQPDPRLQALAWDGLDASETLTPSSALSVGIARGGVAETGSLIFHSGATFPILSAYCALHHVVALDAQKLMLRLEDYAIGEAGRTAPHNFNLITGASGTTDIEGVLARGAHGPRRLHIVIYG